MWDVWSNGFQQNGWGNARFNRYDGCGMHGSTGMMGAGYKDFTRMVGGNARFNRYDG